jgi:segregation and condensation protein A
MHEKIHLYETEIEHYIEYVQELSYKAKNNEIEPNEICLIDIIEKYIEHMINSRPNSIDLDIAADFLVSISNLILWKSYFLLPIKQEKTEEDFEKDENISDEEYWLEYKKYHSLINFFEDKETIQKNIFLTSLDPKIEKGAKYQRNDFSDLILAIESILNRGRNNNNTINLKKHKYNILQKINDIEKQFKRNNGKISFQKMISINFSRLEIIVTFLALLELICQGRVYYKQSQNFGDIIFYRKDDKKLATKKIHL